MKKWIAKLMVLVMMFTYFGDISLAKTSRSLFEVYVGELNNESQGFSEGPEVDKDTGIKNYDKRRIVYTRIAGGAYSFDYYIEDVTGQAWKIIAELEKISDEETKLKLYAQAKKEGSDIYNSKFLLREMEGSQWKDKEVLNQESYEKTLKQGSSGNINDNLVYIKLQDIKVKDNQGTTQDLTIKMKLDGQNIQLSTNGLKKGVITEITLDDGSSTPEIYPAFPGIEGYEIKPQHFTLKEGKLQSQTVLEYPAKEEMMGPGDRPGVLVSYNKIKKINRDDLTFEVDQDFKITNRLDNSAMVLSYQAGSNKVAYENGSSKGEIANANQMSQDKVNIYLASPEVIEILGDVGKNQIIPWNGLTYSNLLGTVQLSFDVEINNETVAFSETINDISKYTYLQYDLTKSPSGDKLNLEITPYLTSDPIMYYVFVSDSEAEISDENKLCYDRDAKKDNQLDYVHSISGSGTQEKLQIELGTQSYFIRVVAVIDKKKVHFSQVVKYNKENLTVKPETPTGLKASNLIVTPSKNSSDIPSAVKVDLEWNAPDKLEKSYLEYGDIYYELILRTQENDSSAPGVSSDAAYSKIYKVSKESSSKPVSLTDIKEQGSYSNGIFKVEDVYLKRASSEKNWEQIVLGTEEEVQKYWDNPSKEILERINESSAQQTLEDKKTGQIYYLSMRAVYVPRAGKAVQSVESALVPLGIDFTKEIIPTVEDLAYSKQDEVMEDAKVKSKVYFSLVNLKDYVKKMLEPAGLRLNKEAENTEEKYKGTYEFFLYKNTTEFDEKAAEKEEAVKLELEGSINVKEYASQLEKGYLRLETEINELLGPSKDGSLDEYIELEGLEPNQAYNIKVRVKLQPYGESGAEEARYSVFSKEFTFTTTTSAYPPTTDERKPPAPDHIVVEAQEGSTSSAKIIWDKADFIKDDDMTIYYELIRSNRTLSEEELLKDMEVLVQSDSKLVGFSSLNPKDNIDQTAYYMTYTQADGWTQISPKQLVQSYQYDKLNSGEKYTLVDDTLAPNTVYYYYVRTVCLIDDGSGKTVVSDFTRTESDWISASITTEMIKPPIHLKVEKSTAYSYDAEHETVISFDAPIPLEADIPKEYDFEIVIKSDADDDYVPAGKVKGPLVQKESDTAGFTHFVYKLSDLNSNTRYDIKVRIVDKTVKIHDENGDSSDQYARSFYSEKVTMRTEYSEEDEMMKEEYEEYLKDFESQINQIKNKPYWVVEEGETYKYRTEFMAADLAIKNKYVLVSEENADRVAYYLPAEVIMAANEADTTFEIVLGEAVLNIRPDTLLEEHEEIKEALKKIASGSIKDYYILIEFSKQAYTGTINGETAISPKLSTDIEIVYLKEEDSEIEVEILEALDKIVDSERKDFISDLTKQLEKNYSDKDKLSSLVEKAVSSVEKSFEKKVSRIITTQVSRQYGLEKVDKAMLLSVKTEFILGNAYYLTSGWQSMTAYSTGASIVLETKVMGTYIFTGQKNLINTVPSLAPYQSFINKYGLTEFFVMDDYFVKAAVTKSQLYGATARVLGAQKGTDYTTYLINKGIKGISKIGQTSNVRQDEAIYIIMQAYEKLHNRKVESIVISNRQSVQNIGAFQSIYRNYVYAAVELKIVQPSNAKVYPSSNLSAETVIRMLYMMEK